MDHNPGNIPTIVIDSPKLTTTSHLPGDIHRGCQQRCESVAGAKFFSRLNFVIPKGRYPEWSLFRRTEWSLFRKKSRGLLFRRVVIPIFFSRNNDPYPSE